VKIPSDDRDEKALIMDAIVGETKSHKVQSIGHVLVIYKPSNEPTISLPKR
jgi:RNA-binding protein